MKTPVEKIFDMLYEGKISDLAELKEWFLVEEEKTIENAILYALDVDGHTGEWRNNFAKEYVDRVIRQKPELQNKKYFGKL
jgi:hypothetical protein